MYPQDFKILRRRDDMNEKLHLPNLERLAVSAKEVARMLGIGKSQVFKLLHEGQFPEPIPLGKRNPRWLISDLEKFLASGGTNYENQGAAPL
jgi:predicted DNA-binding transcriptional regulator AlpA